MPQSPLSDLVVTNAGTILRQVDTLQFTGDGVAITPGSPNPRVAVVDIPGGGAATVAAESLFGNPGTVAAAGTNVAVGSGLTLTNTGSLEATGGGGGGPSILTESGAAEKISAMPTLSNPPLAPVFDSVITNDGTTATNYQRPQGQIVQPAATGTDDGLGILLVGGESTGQRGGGAYLNGGDVINPGTAYQIYAGAVGQGGGSATITDSAGYGIGGAFFQQAGNAQYGSSEAQGAGNQVLGGVFNSGVFIGGSFVIYAGAGNPSGDLKLYSYATPNSGGTNGNVIINAAAPTPPTSSTNCGFIIRNLDTVDPHVLDQAWLGVGNGITLSVG